MKLRVQPLVGSPARALGAHFQSTSDIEALFDAAAEGDDRLERVAVAMQDVFVSPWETRRGLENLALLDSVATAAEELCAYASQNRASGRDHLLALVDRWTPQGAVLVAVNTSPIDGLHLTVEATPATLGPLAIAESGAVDYCLVQPLMNAHARIRSDDDELSATVAIRESLEPPPSSPTGVDLDASVFRGRDEQLARLSNLLALQGQTRPGALIWGPRRAGKTTLAYRAAKIAEEQNLSSGSVYIDVGALLDPTHLDTYPESLWRVVRYKVGRVHSGLETTVAATADVVELLVVLDDALAGHGPLVIVLDELDTLIVQDSESAPHRLAQRLGSLMLRNVQLIATVQRFHRDAVQFKGWPAIECPADLAWGDAVTYFFPRLFSRAQRTSVEAIRGLTVTPAVFRDIILPRIGLRPYFWDSS
jgi:hypothetical protein